MAEPNPFDQFDATKGPPSNPFDVFDKALETNPGPLPDWLFEHGQRGSILHQFGQGFEQGWGAEPLGLSDESADFFRKAGIFNDLDKGHQDWLRTVNEALIRPAAVALDASMRTGTALLRGGQAAVASLAEPPPPVIHTIPGPEELVPGLAREVAALPEAFPRLGIREAGGMAAELGMPRGPVELPAQTAANIAAVRALTPPDLAEARSFGVIGEGEDGWLGTKAPEEPGGPADQARAASIKAVREAAEEEPSLGPQPGTQAASPTSDINQIARQIAPDTFREWDALNLQRDTLRRYMDDLRGGKEFDDLDTQITALRGQRLLATPRERGPFDDQINALEDQRERLKTIFDDGRDTPEMARVRQSLQEADYRMRDLAEPVSAAYREAGSPAAAEPIPEAAPPPAAAPTIEAEALQATPAAPSGPPINIRDDITRQLIEAGRPPEEANAAAALVAAHYDARAARFDGALGDASALYRAEAPTIRAAQRGREGAAGQTILKDGAATINLMGKADASTFIHEIGHTWLEELMRDAGHDLAPDDLKSDAATVRNWLGVEGETIPTRGHEKFARGFERYMMEGRAPTAGLARVFDQFKQWLTQIYQTVGRLRAPITDDIRHVYDRLITPPNREPVIAPDIEIPKDFAAEHEALEERTPGTVAHAAAERVRAEADRKATEEAPEVYNELAGRGPEPRSPIAEAPANAAEGGGPSGNGPTAQPRAPAPPVPVTIGAEREGGVEAAPQGAGVGGATAEAERTFIPAGPEQPFATRNPESPLVDRAGNIRLDLLGTPEDINQAIRDAASENDEFLGNRRGIISDAEVLRLADALGMDAGTLNRRRLGQAFNAEQVIAARKLLVQSATTVRDAAIKAANGTDQDLMAYAMATDRHRMIQGQVAGVTAEAGRALRAFAQIPEGMAQANIIGEFVKDATGRTLNQLRREAQAASQLETPQQISKFALDMQKPGAFDWLEGIWINGKLSGPATHGTYTIANSLLKFWGATAEKAATVAVGAARRAITGEEETERYRLGEVQAELWGLLRGQRDAWQAAWGAFKSGQTTILPGEAHGATAFPSLERRLLATGTQEGSAAHRAAQVVELPARGIAAIHSWTRTSAYEGSIAAQSYRIATNEGLAGDALARRINQLRTNPTDEMMREAVGTANESALMQRSPYGSFTSKVRALVNTPVPIPEDIAGIHLGLLRPGRFIDPFVQISSNIIRGSVERSPLAPILGQSIRDDLMGRNGTMAFDRAAGRMAAGTAFYLAAGGLAAEGLITGSAPDDYHKAALREMTGWRAHSLLLGDVYRSTQRLGILGMQLGIAADLWQIAHIASTEDMAAVAGMASHAFAQNILDESFMRGPADLLGAFEDKYKAQTFARNFLASFVPFDVGQSQIARTIDPYTRQARSALDVIMGKTPWASEELMPRRDMWGEPIPNDQSILPGLTAIWESRTKNDPVVQRMLALGMSASWPRRTIRGVPLTDQQYDDYSKNAGRIAKMRLDRVVAAPGFAQSPPEHQIEVIRRTIAKSRESAEAPIMMENNGALLKQANAAKRALARPSMNTP